MNLLVRRMLVAAGLFGGATAALAQSSSSPVELTFGPTLRPTSHVLHRDGDASLVRAASATDADFQDLYVLHLAEHFAPPAFLAEVGDVVAFAPLHFAVVRIPEDKVDEISGRMHHDGAACGALLKLDGESMATMPAATPTPQIPLALRDTRVLNAVNKVSGARIRTTIAELSKIPTRFHTSTSGLGVAEVLAQKFENLKGTRDDITVSTYDHGRATPQKSVIVRIEGSKNPQEIVIIGSHLDSVNWQGSSASRSPGADDNASGTATNLEVFQLLMEEGYRPERTVEFHAYAAEEIGLVGSQNIATNYRKEGKNVVAMLQNDMNAYKAPGAPDKIWFVTSNTDDGLNNMLGSLVDTYVGMPWGKKALTGGSSDHASWRRQGYATAFPFEDPANYNRNIHTAYDTLSNATAVNQTAGFAKLGLAYLYHFAGA